MKIWTVLEHHENGETYFRKACLTRESAEKFCHLHDEKRSIKWGSGKTFPNIFDRRAVWWHIEEVEVEE